MTTPQLFRLPEVRRMVCLSRTSIYRLMRERKFPRPIRIGDKAIAWREDDLQEWLASRAEASREVA